MLHNRNIHPHVWRHGIVTAVKLTSTDKSNKTVSTKKCDEILYFDFSILQYGPDVEPAGPLQHIDETHAVAQVIPRPARPLVVLTVVGAFGTRVDVHPRRRRYEHYNKWPPRWQQAQ